MSWCRINAAAVFVFCVAAGAACEGPEGPMGPAGPAGPGTRVAVTATVNSSGVAVAALPASVGTSLSDPPGLTCYVNQPGTNSQLLIGTDLDGPACGLTVSGATLNAVMIDAPPGWNARFVAVR